MISSREFRPLNYRSGSTDRNLDFEDFGLRKSTVKNDEGIGTKKSFTSFYQLLFKSGFSIALVNWLSFFRILAFPVLVLLVLVNYVHIFKWLLLVTFLTDAADGFLARRLKATTTLGAKLDSIGDDLTIAASLVGMLFFYHTFLMEQILIVVMLFALFFVQIGFALNRYGKLTSFHTYVAKLAAVSQGTFFLAAFFFNQPYLILFYITSVITALELLEETLIVIVLPKWRTDVKGFYWAVKNRFGLEK